MNKPLFIILANEDPDDHGFWLKACEEKSDYIDFKVIDLSRHDWFEKIVTSPRPYFYLTKPPGISSVFKQQYDERLTIIANSLNLPIFPSLMECLIYENKRFLSYWLKANNIPHPETSVFYNQLEALQFVDNCNFPMVGKVNIGASGSGVNILYSSNLAKKYIRKTFSSRGAKRRSGPNFAKGGILRRGMHYLFHPLDINKKLRIYKKVRQNQQSDFVILQEFVPHTYEWRVVRIGDSFFAHKKIVKNHKASGCLLKRYEDPNPDLLNFVKGITDKHHFKSQAIDIFESSRGYLVNEMQCIFGQSDPYQMLINEKFGRYIYEKNQWVFEEGDFNKNQSYNLRLEYLLDLI